MSSKAQEKKRTGDAMNEEKPEKKKKKARRPQPKKGKKGAKAKQTGDGQEEEEDSEDEEATTEAVEQPEQEPEDPVSDLVGKARDLSLAREDRDLFRDLTTSRKPLSVLLGDKSKDGSPNGWANLNAHLPPTEEMVAIRGPVRQARLRYLQGCLDANEIQQDQ